MCEAATYTASFYFINTYLLFQYAIFPATEYDSVETCRFVVRLRMAEQAEAGPIFPLEIIL